MLKALSGTGVAREMKGDKSEICDDIRCNSEKVGLRVVKQDIQRRTNLGRHGVPMLRSSGRGWGLY